MISDGVMLVPAECMGSRGSFPGALEHRDPMLIYICCVRYVFLCSNTDFVGSTNTINICLYNVIDIYSFIHVSGYVGVGPSELLFLGAINTVKTALNTVFKPLCLTENIFKKYYVRTYTILGY